MIELNLLPNVKQASIRAQRVRNTVVSASIVLSVVVGGLAALLASYVFVAQPVVISRNKDEIKKLHKEFTGKEDITNAITLKNQVAAISDQYKNMNLTSRLFDTMSTIVPKGENAIRYKNIALDSAEKTITIEAEAKNGYSALETFKKTILNTKFEFMKDGADKRESVNLTDKISDGDRQLTENSEGEKVLRFQITFVYNDALFSRDSKDGQIVGPTERNATDSTLSVPKSLFGGGEQ